MGKLRFSSLLIALTLSTSPLSAAESGWFRTPNYFKPFVKVENFKDRQVLFITNEGRVYTGRCRKRKGFYNYCYVVPGKKFSSIDGGITFIVLKVDGFYPPRVLEYGVVDNFNVKLKDEKF